MASTSGVVIYNGDDDYYYLDAYNAYDNNFNNPFVSVFTGTVSPNVNNMQLHVVGGSYLPTNFILPSLPTENNILDSSFISREPFSAPYSASNSFTTSNQSYIKKDNIVVSGTPANKKSEDILRIAKSKVGTEEFRTANNSWGALACATAVSGILKQAGALQGSGSDSQAQLEVILRNQGYTDVKESDVRPGDIIFFDPKKGGKHGHVGIIEGKDEKGNIIMIDNDPKAKVVKQHNVSKMSERPVRAILRVPSDQGTSSFASSEIASPLTTGRQKEDDKTLNIDTAILNNSNNSEKVEYNIINQEKDIRKSSNVSKTISSNLNSKSDFDITASTPTKDNQSTKAPTTSTTPLGNTPSVDLNLNSIYMPPIPDAYTRVRSADEIKGLVIHKTMGGAGGDKDFRSAYNTFSKPWKKKAEGSRYENGKLIRGDVSIHWMIDRNGQIYHSMDENKAAWHAGVGSVFAGEDANISTLGVELVSKGNENPTKQQMESLAKIAIYVNKKYGIKAENIIGHKDISKYGKPDGLIESEYKYLRDAVASGRVTPYTGSSDDDLANPAVRSTGEVSAASEPRAAVGVDHNGTTTSEQATGYQPVNSSNSESLKRGIGNIPGYSSVGSEVGNYEVNELEDFWIDVFIPTLAGSLNRFVIHYLPGYKG